MLIKAVSKNVKGMKNLPRGQTASGAPVSVYACWERTQEGGWFNIQRLYAMFYIRIC